jgi:hypothetical protein
MDESEKAKKLKEAVAKVLDEANSFRMLGAYYCIQDLRKTYNEMFPEDAK